MALSHGPSVNTSESTSARVAPQSGVKSALAAKSLAALMAVQSMVAGCTVVGSPRPGTGMDGGFTADGGQSFDGGSRRGPDIQLLDLGGFPTIDIQEPIDLGGGNNPQPTPDAGSVDTGVDSGTDTGAETTPDTVGADTVNKLQNCLQEFQGKACDVSVNPKTKIKIKGTWNCQPDGTPNCVPN